MTHSREGGFESSQSRFEREVVESMKRAMKEAMAQATSKEDAKQRIEDALSEGPSFIGPIVEYSEVGEGEDKKRSILARVQTLNDQRHPVEIKVQFTG